MAHNRNQYILGQPGSGKSTLMLSIAETAINQNEGLCYIDPHGSDIDTLMQTIPRRRLQDVVLFDPTFCSIPWNPLRSDNPPLAATVLSDSIKDAWGYAAARAQEAVEYLL